MAHGEVDYFELPYDDEERAATFYRSLFGWGIRTREDMPGHLPFRTASDGIGGALGLRGVAGPSQPRLYVQVESLDEALAKLDALGGSVVVERAEFGGGAYAAITDSEGNEIGIWEPAAG